MGRSRPAHDAGRAIEFTQRPALNSPSPLLKRRTDSAEGQTRRGRRDRTPGREPARPASAAGQGPAIRRAWPLRLTRFTPRRSGGPWLGSPISTAFGMFVLPTMGMRNARRPARPTPPAFQAERLPRKGAEGDVSQEQHVALVHGGGVLQRDRLVREAVAGADLPVRSVDLDEGCARAVADELECRRPRRRCRRNR